MALRLFVFVLACSFAFAQRGYWPPQIRPLLMGSILLNSTAPKRAGCFMPTRNVSIDAVTVYIWGVTVGDTLTISIQPATSSGFPSGTILASGSIAVTPGMAGTDQTIALNQTTNLSVDTIYCVVYELPETPTGSFTVGHYYELSAYTSYITALQYSGGNWAIMASAQMSYILMQNGVPQRLFSSTYFADNLWFSADVEYGLECLSTANWRIIGLKLTGGTSNQAKPETSLRVYVNGVLRGTATAPSQPLGLNSHLELDAILPSSVDVAAGNIVTISAKAAQSQQVLVWKWKTIALPPWKQALGMNGMTACKSGVVSNGRVTTPEDRLVYALGFLHEGASRISGGFMIQQ